MKVIYLAVFGGLLSIQSCYSQSKPTFENILSQVQTSPKINDNKRIEDYIRENSSTPIVENNTIIFLAKSSASTPPKLVSDFNGFMNPRYVKDSTLADMTPIQGTSWHYSKYSVPLNTVINYQFLYGEERINDPLNPNLRINFGSPISFVEMPERETFGEGLQDFSVGKGQLIQEEFESKILKQTRKIHVYLPYGYTASKTYPSVFFHDGSFFIKEGGVPNILNNLISANKIQPMIAIFDDPIIRGKEYRNDPDFRNYIQNELLTYINEKYNTSNDSNQRAVIGFSRGGMSALYLSHSLEEFSMCGAFSPAIHPKTVNEFKSELNNFQNEPKVVFVSGSTFDKIWYQDALDLKTHFEGKVVDLSYKEINEGHNIAAWRTMLDDMLITFFPMK